MLTCPSRRDGSPFLNLLMTAPLYDNRGSVRYFIGAQVDVTKLVENGRGIDSFERLLAEENVKEEPADPAERQSNGTGVPKKPLEALGELGEMLSWDETMEIQARSRTASLRDDSSMNSSTTNIYGKRNIPTRAGGRRVLGTGSDDEADERAAWGLSGSGLSGRLPGLYQNVTRLPVSAIWRSKTDILFLVSPRPPVPFPTDHLRLTCTPHSRASSEPFPIPHRWACRYPRRHRRCLCKRRPCHGKSFLAASWPG